MSQKSVTEPIKGVKLWKNPSNQFICCQLHYTADPDKDPSTPKGKEWYDSVSAGFPVEGWKREMEIDWTTMEGKPVYSQFSMKQVVEGLRETWTPDQVLYRGWDFGYHHPVVNFSCVNKHDQWNLLHEEHGCDTPVLKFGHHIKDVTEALFPEAMIRDFFPHDAAFVKDIATEKEEETIAAILENIGISGQITRSDLMAGIELKRRKMVLRADGKYGMQIDSRMTQSIAAFQGGYHRSPREGNEDKPVKDGIHDDPMDAARMTAVNIFSPEMTESLKEGKVTFADDIYEYDELTGCIVG